MVQLESLRILVWSETGRSASFETVIVQIMVDGENPKQFSYRFSADELQRPRYNRLLIDLCRQFRGKGWDNAAGH
jgi:hypothetical protein